MLEGFSLERNANAAVKSNAKVIPKDCYVMANFDGGVYSPLKKLNSEFPKRYGSIKRWFKAFYGIELKNIVNVPKFETRESVITLGK